MADEGDTTASSTSIISSNLVDAGATLTTGANDEDKTGSFLGKSSPPLSASAGASNTNHHHGHDKTKVC